MKKLLKLIDIKFFKFVLVGFINAGVDAGLSFLLINLTHISMWWCTAVPCALASVVSYFLNKHFTFKNTEKGWKPVFRFALNIALCYLIAYGIAIPVMQWVLASADPNLRDNITKVVGMVLFSCCNYVGQRMFAFRNRKKK